MGWIKFDTDTSDKPEVWQIANDLGVDSDAVVGKLLRVWAWFDDHTLDGNAPCVTKKLLDRAVGVAGFCDAMVASGWMLDDGATISLSNFDRHNGKTAKDRALTAIRVANHKAKSNGECNDHANGVGVSDALPRERVREEKSNKKDQKQKIRAPRSANFTAKDLIDQHGVDKRVAEDFLETRKAKRLANTPTALDGLIREFTLANLLVADGIRLCTEKGWGGFNHKWPTDGGSNGPGNQGANQGPMSAPDRVRAAIAARETGSAEGGRTLEHQ